MKGEERRRRKERKINIQRGSYVLSTSSTENKTQIQIFIKSIKHAKGASGKDGAR